MFFLYYVLIICYSEIRLVLNILKSIFYKKEVYNEGEWCENKKRDFTRCNRRHYMRACCWVYLGGGRVETYSRISK